MSWSSAESNMNSRCFQQQVLEQSPGLYVPEMTEGELSMSTWAHVQIAHKFCSTERLQTHSLAGVIGMGKWGQSSFYFLLDRKTLRVEDPANKTNKINEKPSKSHYHLKQLKSSQNRFPWWLYKHHAWPPMS